MREPTAAAAPVRCVDEAVAAFALPLRWPFRRRSRRKQTSAEVEVRCDNKLEAERWGAMDGESAAVHGQQQRGQPQRRASAGRYLPSAASVCAASLCARLMADGGRDVIITLSTLESYECGGRGASTQLTCAWCDPPAPLCRSAAGLVPLPLRCAALQARRLRRPPPRSRRCKLASQISWKRRNTANKCCRHSQNKTVRTHNRQLRALLDHPHCSAHILLLWSVFVSCRALSH